MSHAASPSGVGVWWRGARPRTLTAAIVPVLVGTAAAGTSSASRTIAALVVALGLQVGVNYLNDYEDGRRNIDDATRVGPVRLVAAGLASPRAAAAAGTLAIVAAGAAGVFLAATAGWWLLGVGAICVLGAFLYSGGPRPYAAAGLGELAVFVFFGIIATCGTAYVQAGHVSARAWWAATSVGLLAVAILLANNLRDILTDGAVGKRTLAVRLGDQRTRTLYRAVVVVAFLVPPAGALLRVFPPTVLLALLAGPPALSALQAAGHAHGGELVPVLKRTAATQLVAGLGLAAGLWLA